MSLEVLESEVAQLEQKLSEARLRLSEAKQKDGVHSSCADILDLEVIGTLHDLQLLSDSALPLGSFAFSSGLESYLAHRPRGGAQSLSSFRHFVHLSLSSLSSTVLPYLLTAYDDPTRLLELDNDIDASITCAVARRASVAQGRALTTLWERSLKANSTQEKHRSRSDEAKAGLEDFCRRIKTANSSKDHGCLTDEFDLSPNGHFPPLFGIVCRALAIGRQQTVYTFLLNHAKTLLSASIRASVLGPYQAQSVLASSWLRNDIMLILTKELSQNRRIEDAGQTVPMLDIWGGRHEIVYSRIFNS